MKPAHLLKFMFAAFAAVASTGCWPFQTAGSVQPVLFFTESTPPWTADGVLGALQNGTITLDDPRLQGELLSTRRCVFSADYSAGFKAPNFLASASPGDPSFTVNFESDGMVQATGSAFFCAVPDFAPTSLKIVTNRGLVVGQATHNGQATLVMNGATFTTDIGVFDFTLGTFDTANNVANASFRFVMTDRANPADTTVLAITSGSFTTPIQ